MAFPLLAQYNTGFDDWPILAEGDWEQVQPEGTYRSNGCYCNFGNTLSGLRKIGFNGVGDALELPPVPFADRVRFQARTSTGSSAELSVQYREGGNWMDAGACPISGPAYQACTVELEGLIGEVDLRIVMTAFGNSVFLDDLEVSGGLLPVELASFTARAEADGRVALRWKTLSERANAEFVLQRSRDGRVFRDLHRVPGAGTTRQPRIYRHWDRPPDAGLWYYRLRQYDWDGQFALSPLVSVRAGVGAQRLRLYPSPARDRLTVELPAVSTPRTVCIADQRGRVLLAEPLPPDATRRTIPVGRLPPGLYVLRLGGDGLPVTRTFVKQ